MSTIHVIFNYLITSKSAKLILGHLFILSPFLLQIAKYNRKL